MKLNTAVSSLFFWHCAVFTLLLLMLLPAISADEADQEQTRLAQLDAYWSRVSKAVAAGDFEAYKSTCHEEGVLVSGKKKTSYPLSEALAGWKQGFLDTKAGKMKASVEFRFSRRWGNDSTAHETGIFLYKSTGPDGKESHAYLHFEGLLVKKKGAWTILMEHQKSEATKEEWDKLQPTSKEKRNDH